MLYEVITGFLPDPGAYLQERVPGAHHAPLADEGNVRPGRLDGRQLAGLSLPLKHAFQLDLAVEIVFRITSYNVCYTKLLRLGYGTRN